MYQSSYPHVPKLLSSHLFQQHPALSLGGADASACTALKTEVKQRRSETNRDKRNHKFEQIREEFRKEEDGTDVFGTSVLACLVAGALAVAIAAGPLILATGLPFPLLALGRHHVFLPVNLLLERRSPGLTLLCTSCIPLGDPVLLLVL